MHIGLQDNRHKPKQCTDGTIRYSFKGRTTFTTEVFEPSSHITAIHDPHWSQVMDNEYEALMRNKTWHLVPSQHGQNLINYKWMLKLKCKADGSID